MTDMSTSLAWHQPLANWLPHLPGECEGECLPGKRTEPLGKNWSKSRSVQRMESRGLNHVVHYPGCFLEVRLCIFKRKARIKQTGAGFSHFVSVCRIIQWGSKASKLPLCSLWPWKILAFDLMSIVFRSLGQLWRVSHSSNTGNKWWPLAEGN